MTHATSDRLAGIATGVLRRFGPANDGLAGDLLEEYRRGFSAAWYAKEVLIAVVAGATLDIWRHKWLAARALVVGWAALIVYGLLVDQAWGSSEFFLTDLTRSHLGPAQSGVVLQWAYLLLAVPGGVGTGWLLSRCHRTCGAGAVVLFVAFILLWRLPWLLTLLANALEHPRFLHALLMSSAGTVLLSTSVLVSGLWAAGVHADKEYLDAQTSLHTDT